eukprot:scpid28652/ scgid31427/ 
MSRQMTLFGKFTQPKDRIVYAAPRTDCDKFVNKFVLHDKRKKGESVKAAVEEWKADYRDAPEKLAAYLATSSDPTTKTDLDFGLQVLDKATPRPSQSSTPVASVVPSSLPTPVADVSAVIGSSAAKKSLNVAAISSCLYKFKVNERELLSEDVTSVPVFMSSLDSFAVAYIHLQHCVRQYDSLLTRGCYGGTRVGQLRSDTETGIQRLSTLLNDISSKQVGTSVVGLLQSSIAKSQLLTSAVGDMTCLSGKMAELRKRLQMRTSQMVQECDASRLSAVLTFQCLQSVALSWESAFTSVTDDLNTNASLHGPLTYIDLLSCGQLLRSTNAIPLDAVLDHCKKSTVSHAGAANMLLERFPVLMVSSGRKEQVLVNLHELVIDSQSLTDLLNLDHGIQESASLVTPSAAASCDQPEDKRRPGPPKGHGGRPAKHLQYPTIVDEVTAFVKLHSFSAQARRRTDAWSSMGVSLHEIRSHLLKTIPGLKEAGISVETVHRLMLPPRKGTTRANQFKALVSARVPRKRNDAVLHEHADHHYCTSLVAAVNEMFQHFGEARLSCDDKNKVNVGTPCVSRYHQLQSFFMVGSSPNLPDHDFPYANSKIIPSGYLVMQTKASQYSARHRHSKRSRSVPAPRCAPRHQAARCKSEPPVSRRSRAGRSTTRCRPQRRCRSLSSQPVERHQSEQRSQSEPRTTTEQAPNFTGRQFRVDKLGRLHVNYPRTGRLHVVNRASKFHQSNAQAHANDLSKIVKQEKFLRGQQSLCLTTDNGPDYSMKSLQTFLYIGRLWRDSDLDVLIQTSYAPGHSAHNMIEHAWAPISRKLAGVTLPITLEGEDKPPCQQSGLNSSEREEKEVEVFDNAIRMLNPYWNDKLYDTFPISSRGIPAKDRPAPYDDAQPVAAFNEAGIREIESKPELKAIQAELQFFAKHSVRSTSLLQFCKCADSACGHCSTRPVRSVQLVNFLRSCPGGHIPLPTPSHGHSGHFMTFLETKAVVEAGQGNRLVGLASAPSATSGKLCKYGCKWLLMSRAASERHELVLHRNERRNEQQQARRQKPSNDSNNSEPSAKPQHCCLFIMDDGTKCGFVGTSAYYLRTHKEKEGHSRKRKSGSCSAQGTDKAAKV